MRSLAEVVVADTRLPEETAASSPLISQLPKDRCCRSSWVEVAAVASPHLLDMAAVAEEVLPPSMPELPSRSLPAEAEAEAGTACEGLA